MPRIFLLQGANLCYLGKREPEIYGTNTPAELDAMVQKHAAAHGYELEILYTNFEGEAITRIFDAADRGVDGLVMNPGGFNYAGYALRSCVKASALPYVEVHITNIEKRGLKSVLSDVAQGVVLGFGPYSYILGLEAMLHLLANKKSPA